MWGGIPEISSKHHAVLLEFISRRESFYKLTYEWHKLIYMRLLKFQISTCHLFTWWVLGWKVMGHMQSVNVICLLYICDFEQVKLRLASILYRCLMSTTLCMWEQTSHMSAWFGGLFGVKPKGHGWHFNVISGWKGAGGETWRRWRQGGQKGVDWGVMAVQQTGLDEEKLWGGEKVY